MRRKYRLLREAAYAEGTREFHDLCAIPTFRDFVCLYVAEGSKRQRNTVALGNSDPKVVALAAWWIRNFSRNPVRFYLQYHADQDVDELRKRTWRSQYGVLTVRACDTLLRARLQAWMDCLRESWLHSSENGA